jgi:dihydroxyacetone kinase-like protein
VQIRGKASIGDKTMVDALAPAAEAARKAFASGGSIEDVAAAAAKAAAAGVEATRGLVAKIGKAKSLGDRSVGFVDPGALTTSILMDSIAATLRDRTR